MLKRSLVPRHPDDFYKTPPRVTRLLLNVERFAGPVWEPACGDGAMAAVLEDAGLSVLASDLVDRGYGEPEMDFLMCRAAWPGDIVTNPPFKLAEEFLTHALNLGAVKVALLLRLSWLEGEARRRSVFSVKPPARVWVLSARPTLWVGDDPNARTNGGATAYAWFVWDRAAPAGASVLGWLGK